MTRKSPFANLILVFVILFGSLAHAKTTRATRPSGDDEGLGFGAGINSFTGGRTIPSLEISYQQTEQAFAWAATGVQSKYYYQSSHLLFYFRTWKAGSMWGGDVAAGFGGGLGYSIRGFQDEGATSEEKVSDFLFGPAIRLSWSFGPVSLSFSTLYGLRDIQKHLFGLNFQDVQNLSLGFRF